MSGSTLDPAKKRIYHYVSPRKVRGLLEQYKPPMWQKLLDNIAEVSVETPFGVKPIIVLTDPAERKKRETLTLTALQAVLKKLKKANDVYSLDDNAVLLHGSVEMYSEIVKDRRTGADVFLTVGATEQSIIALGGNALNIWGGGGGQPRQATATPISEPSVLATLMEADEQATHDFAAHSAEHAEQSPNAEVTRYTADLYYHWGLNRAGTMRYEIFIEQHRRTRLGPPHPNAGMQVVIGSPIFVALAV